MGSLLGGGTQGSNQTAEPWSGVHDPMIDVINQGASLYGSPYQQYGGQRVAGPADSTIAGQNLLYQRATLGSPDLTAARGYTTDLSTGAFMGQGPTAQNQWLGGTAQGQNLNSNPWLGSQYTDEVIKNNANDMAGAFATGTNATNMANFAQQGAFGGSAYQEKMSADAANLAKQVGAMGSQYRLANQQMGAQDYQQSVQNAMGANTQQQGAYNNDVAARMQGAQLAGQLSQDDWTAAKALTSQGNDQRAYNQQLLDQQYGDWQAQMNAPQQNLTNYANLLSQLGGFGSSGTTQTYGGGGSPLGQIAGLGLLGAAGTKAAGVW